MNRYQNGKIYKIVDVGYSKCYIGSTCENLCVRMARHKYHYNHRDDDAYKNKHTNVNLLFDEFGKDSCKIELIETYPCNNKEELTKREGCYIQNTDCINKRIEGRTKQEYHNDNKEYFNNKAKDYHKEHREDILDRKKNYYQENREEKIQKARDSRLVIVDCECGVSISKPSLKRHLKSTKHKTLLQEINKSSE